MYEVAPNTEEDERWLEQYLQRIYLWANAAGETGKDIKASWSDGALLICDIISERIEKEEHEVTARLGPMALKLSMLASLSDTPPDSDTIEIEEQHAEQAKKVIDRWKIDALRFEDEIGGLSAYQRKAEHTIDRITRLMRERGGSIPRSVVGRTLKIEARQLNQLEDTLSDRAIIEVSQQAAEGAGRPAKVWRLL